jgi:hypothetical protein
MKFESLILQLIDQIIEKTSMDEDLFIDINYKSTKDEEFDEYFIMKDGFSKTL